MKNTRSILFCVLLLNSALMPAIPQSQSKHEQKIFSSESMVVNNPIPVADEILAFLAKDSHVKDVISNYEIKPDRVPDNWLHASRIHTAHSTDNICLVIADWPLSGAHATTFWLLKLSEDHKVHLLFTVVADALEIGKIDSSGFPRLIATQLTGVSITDTIFKYKTNKYVVVKTAKETFNHKK